MSGPLKGIKILGFTHFAQAPFALQLLGDLGADVVNVERPGTGDYNRTFLKEEMKGDDGPFFLAMNRNKRSLTLDLKNPAAKEIVVRLFKQVDVVVSNYRPGVLDKLGIGYEEAKKANGSIVFCEALGYGSSGPYAKLPGQDLLAQALSGYATIVGQDGDPQTGGGYLADMYSAIILVVGVLSAILNIKNGGKAQKVEVNLFNSALHLQSQELVYFLNTGNMPKRPKNHSGHVFQESPYGIFKTRNGYMALSANVADNIPRFAEILGIEGLPAMMPDKPTALRDRDKLNALIGSALATKDTEHWIAEFREAGFWCSRVNDYQDVVVDPQVVHNKMIREVEHPKAGKIKLVAPPIEFSETPIGIRRAPPVLGQHTEEVLGEIGYSSEEIAAMKANKVF